MRLASQGGVGTAAVRSALIHGSETGTAVDRSCEIFGVQTPISSY